MKATIEIPDEVMRAVKIRAAQEDQELKDTVTELLLIGLANVNSSPAPVGVQSVFPVFSGGHPALPDEEMMPDRVAEILMEDEVDRALGR